jgi:hypothetical protein
MATTLSIARVYDDATVDDRVTNRVRKSRRRRG